MRTVPRLLRAVVLWLLVAGLAGCEVELYSGLAERDGNDMLALLAANGIVAGKVSGKDQVVTLSVDQADVATAIDILNRNGYPRDSFVSLGDIFKKEGLISSPFEERVRYTYGLSQGISETLTRIDGVIAARVHISIPQQKAYGKNDQTPSASVFVKYRIGSGVDQDIGKIKLLVQNSVQSLGYDKISVALFEGQADSSVASTDGPPLQQVLGVRVTRDSMARLEMLAVAFGLLLLAVLGGAGYFLSRRRRAAAGESANG